MNIFEDMLLPGLILFSLIAITLLVWFLIRVNAQTKKIAFQKKRVEELLQIQQSDKNRINELEKENQQLFGVVSHDVKGPLNRIFALIQLIQLSSANLQNDQKDYLGKIHIMIADGLGLIRNLADVQKLEGKGIELNPDSFNLSSVLGTMARNYTVIADKKKITVHIDIPPALMVFADRHYTIRIFDNLLSNAIKFSAENKAVFIRTKDDGNKIRIEVRDEGPGFSESDQMRLYKKFQTLTAKPTAGETATGIGLSLVKTLAEKTGAEISCTSRLGEGTTFTVSIRKSMIS